MSDEIQTAKKNIVNLLNDAGGDGLHQDDILYLLGFKTKKELIPRLRELRDNSEILEVEGGRWKKIEMNGTTEHLPTETFISPSLLVGQELPSIYLPGDEKFSSYKNSFQEFCQKKRFPVPQYKALKESNGLVGTVSFSLNFVRCTEISGSVKEAESRAAFETLQALGYIQHEKFAPPTNQLKRKENGGGDYASKVAKQIKTGPTGTPFKSQLNEYVQKKQISVATYETVAVNGGFFSTVTVNDTRYKAMSTCKKRKEAEQNAAQVALNDLMGIPLPADGQNALLEEDVGKMVAEARQAAQPVALKNRLQEYCQRMSKPMPTYDTKMNEASDKSKTFQSTVDVQDVQYTGASVKGKKNAETSAAEAALKALGLMV